MPSEILAVTFNLDPPKIGSPRNKFFWNIWIHSENQWLLRTLVEFTVAYLEKWMTAFHEYALAAPRSVRNVSSLQTLHNVRGKWLLRAAGNETTVAELTGLSSLQKPRKPPRYATGPSFASEICSGSTFFHLWEMVQIFQRESIFCSKVSSGGSLFIEILVRGKPILGGPFLPWHSYTWWLLEVTKKLYEKTIWSVFFQLLTNIQNSKQ